MNLQDLIYFKKLSENLSFTETAHYFYVSQPSISTAVKRLETELNTTLIDRRKTLKSIQLTPTGRILYENTVKMLLILENTKQEIKDFQDERVYYGFLPTIGGSLLPKILPKLQRFTKSIHFIEEESSDEMLKFVKNEEVPIAIIGHDKMKIATSKILQIPVLAEEMALWVAPNHPLANKNEVTASEIKNEVFISLSEGYTHQRIFYDWAKEHLKVEQDVVYAKEIKTVLSIAASTNMVAFMSDIVVDQGQNLIKVSLKNAPKFYVSLILNQESEHSLYQQEFNEAVIQAVKSSFN